MRIIELSDLHVFRTVARAGGILRAAERLHRVQSNVTTRVKKLEAELGVELFLREGRRLQLSPAGHVLLAYADQLLALAEEARDAVHAKHPRGPIRLGAMESTAAARLPGLLRLLQGRYPELAVELQTGDPQVLMQRVLAGELDAALVTEPIGDARLDSAPAFDERLVLVTTAQATPPSRDRSRPLTMLAFHPGCPYRSRFESWCARRKLAVARVIEVASYHAILGCAEAGMGTALVPECVLATYTGTRRLGVHALPGSHGHARTLLVWRRNAPQAKVRALGEAIASYREQGLGPTRRRVRTRAPA